MILINTEMTFFFHNKTTGVLALSMLWSIVFFGATETFSAETLPSYHPLTEERTVLERRSTAPQMNYNVNKKFESVAERFGNGDLEGAMKSLRSMLNWNINDYERAVVYQFMGFVYVQQSNIDMAIEVFRKCTDLDVLSTSQHQSTVFNLASLYGSREEWDLTISKLMQWFKYEPDPVVEAYIMMGIAYFQKGETLTSLPYIHIANINSKKPQESWHQLELAILFLNKRFEEAVELLKRMATYWPDKEKYWETMAGTYMELQKDPDALSALTLGYKNNAISKKETLENLARLSLYLEIPYQAASIVEENINNGSLERNEKNLRLLLGAWTAAREFDQAIGVINILAPMINDGDLYIQKAMLLNEKGDWEGIKVAASEALNTGSLEKPGDIYILKGMAQTELEEYDQAINSFEKAVELGTDGNKRNAEAWIEYVTDRKGS
jgi:tetratricopeptide (TPR) repeat protein